MLAFGNSNKKNEKSKYYCKAGHKLALHSSRLVKKFVPKIKRFYLNLRRKFRYKLQAKKSILLG